MIYLDNASTTFPKPPAVLAAMQRYLTDCGVSPGRGGYAAAVAADRLVADVRRRLTRLVRGDEPARMVLASSCTDALNLALHGVLRAGDHVVTTALEHNSMSRPLETLRRSGMITLTRVGFGAAGLVDPDEIAAAVQPQTRLIALNHASNVTGIIQPAAEVGAIAEEHGTDKGSGVVIANTQRHERLARVPRHLSRPGQKGDILAGAKMGHSGVLGNPIAKQAGPSIRNCAMPSAETRRRMADLVLPPTVRTARMTCHSPTPVGRTTAG